VGLYRKYILPKVVDLACKSASNKQQREKVIPLATGNVLEVGVGSGLNLPFYDGKKVVHLTAVDPSEEMWNENIIVTEDLPYEFEFIKSLAENIPAESNSYDTVVITYTLCTIKDASSALSEMRRVLKPGGKLLFCEHGKAPDKNVQRWQHIINPLWGLLGGGCDLTKNIPAIIEDNGFKIRNLDTGYVPGWKVASFDYLGMAKPN